MTEAFKLASSCCSTLNNYMVFNDIDGIYTYTYEAERKEDCIVCSPASRPKYINVMHDGLKLSEFLDILTGVQYQMRSPGVLSVIHNKNRTLYMSTPASIEEITRVNLKKSLKELSLINGTKLIITDSTRPTSLELILKYSKIDDQL